METRTQTSVAEPRRKDAQNEALREVDARPAALWPPMRAHSTSPIFEPTRSAPSSSDVAKRQLSRKRTYEPAKPQLSQ